MSSPEAIPWPAAPHLRNVVVWHGRDERGHPHGDVVHTGHGLTYIVEGWAELHVDGPIRVEAGSFLVMPAGVPHRVLRRGQVERWSVGFCTTCIGLSEDQPLMQAFARVRRGAVAVVPVAADRRDRVQRLFAELQEESARDVAESPELERCLVLLLLGELRRAMTASPPALAHGSWVADALAFIQGHALQPISLRDVAAAVHRSPAHVATTVRKSTGFTVGEWIVSSRVASAAGWLLHSDEALGAIASKVGWQDKTHFIRQFRKVHGMTPAAWRRMMREELCNDN